MGERHPPATEGASSRAFSSGKVREVMAIKTAAERLQEAGWRENPAGRHLVGASGERWEHTDYPGKIMQTREALETLSVVGVLAELTVVIDTEARINETLRSYSNQIAGTLGLEDNDPGWQASELPGFVGAMVKEYQEIREHNQRLGVYFTSIAEIVGLENWTEDMVPAAVRSLQEACLLVKADNQRLAESLEHHPGSPAVRVETEGATPAELGERAARQESRLVEEHAGDRRPRLAKLERSFSVLDARVTTLQEISDEDNRSLATIYERLDSLEAGASFGKRYLPQHEERLLEHDIQLAAISRQVIGTGEVELLDKLRGINRKLSQHSDTISLQAIAIDERSTGEERLRERLANLESIAGTEEEPVATGEGTTAGNLLSRAIHLEKLCESYGAAITRGWEKLDRVTQTLALLDTKIVPEAVARVTRLEEALVMPGGKRLSTLERQVEERASESVVEALGERNRVLSARIEKLERDTESTLSAHAERLGSLEEGSG